MIDFACDARHLLETVGKLNAIEDAQTLLDALAEAVAHAAGYRIALISVTLPQGVMLGAHNLPAAVMEDFREEALAMPPGVRVARRERIRELAFPGTGIAYVPHGTPLPFTPLFRPTENSGAGSWHPEDRLFLLLRGPAGRDIGVASLDEPKDGASPREESLGSLRLAEQLLEIGGSYLHARLVEAELRQSEERFRRLVDSSTDGILVESQGRIVFANRACGMLFAGGDPLALIGMATEALVHPSDRHAEAPAGPAPETAARPTRMVRLDGSIVAAERIGIPIEYAGRPAVQLIVRDVGERLRLEEQVRQSHKMEAVGRLAGGVAHEFNNLLTVITGFGQLLEARFEDDPGATSHIGRILAASDRAATLTRQLLALGRKQSARPALLDVNALVTETARMIAHLAGPGIAVGFEPAPSLGRTVADPSLVTQVLMNLAVNACDAMPRGGRLTIATRDVVVGEPFVEHPSLRVPSGAYVAVTVTDTGTGMDESTLAHLFEPFFTTKAAGKGPGLGLATAFGIVTQCGGDIVCTSRLGAGTTFSIYLPRAGEPATDDTASKAIPTSLSGARTILVVDDETAIRSFLRDILIALGHRVLVAGDGHEALALSASHTGVIDMLLTDVGLPLMDGRELAKRFAEARPATRVLFVSGYLGAAEGGSLQLPPEAAFLPKPFGPADLAAKVESVFAGASAWEVGA